MLSIYINVRCYQYRIISTQLKLQPMCDSFCINLTWCTAINDVKTMRRINSSYHSANVKRSILLNEWNITANYKTRTHDVNTCEIHMYTIYSLACFLMDCNDTSTHGKPCGNDKSIVGRALAGSRKCENDQVEVRRPRLD